MNSEYVIQQNACDPRRCQRKTASHATEDATAYGPTGGWFDRKADESNGGLLFRFSRSNDASSVENLWSANYSNEVMSF